MKHTYSHIDMAERRKIYRWTNIGMSVDMIAEKLGRHRSTIFRELKRNRFKDPELEGFDGYYAVIANEKAQERRYCQRKLVRFSKLRDAVIDRLKHGWSSEQIAGRLKFEGRSLRVSHETIYQFAHSKCGQEIELWKCLP